MIDWFPVVTIFLLLIVLAFLIVLLRRPSRPDHSVLLARLDAVETAQEHTEHIVREELSLNREELGKTGREQRKELTEALRHFGDSVLQRIIDAANFQKGQLDDFSNHLASLTKAIGERFDNVRSESALSAKHLREEVISALKGITETTTKTMSELSNLQKDQLEAMSTAIGKLADKSEESWRRLRCTVEAKLQSMQIDNAKQLDQMRQTVDEKLQGTLEKTLRASPSNR